MATPRRVPISAITVGSILLIGIAVQTGRASSETITNRFARLNDATCDEGIIISSEPAPLECAKLPRRQNEECAFEAAVGLCASVDECGGFVLDSELRTIHIFTSDGSVIQYRERAGWILFEMKQVLKGERELLVVRSRYAIEEDRANGMIPKNDSNGSQDGPSDSAALDVENGDVLMLLENDEVMRSYLTEALDANEEILGLEKQILAFAEANPNDESDQKDLMLEALAKAQEKVLEQELEKAAGTLLLHHHHKKPKPSIVCHPGHLEGGGYEPGVLITGKPAEYTPGFCKKPQVIPRHCEASHGLIPRALRMCATASCQFPGADTIRLIVCSCRFSAQHAVHREENHPWLLRRWSVRSRKT